ncbi:Cys-tRNA(Pro) deacylase [Asanoa siamensis]|uniref:Cys-tRNA(Pro)/Cys-tRNA(Cys) deacylase n=1 Tax=Asanoa siamensis TaxID=926357 RepID=A0ABQ4CNV4_9ACTN|nr:Cys-tRNA(Pro) deacylase [Asanoa siamensis]GIF72942.1 Cys-tRNA(Pro)/Cys-tRNA(Cys) deacylase [Asanoa siamensis]
MAKRAQGTPATVVPTREKVPFTTHPYSVDPKTPSYGEAVAAALGIDPPRVFKTLVASIDGQLGVGVVPVARSLDLKALAAALGGKKAAMAEPAAAERATGYVTGGISPLGQRSRLPIVLDESAMAHATIFVSAGKRGLQLELAPSDLVHLTGAAVALIATS